MSCWALWRLARIVFGGTWIGYGLFFFAVVAYGVVVHVDGFGAVANLLRILKVNMLLIFNLLLLSFIEYLALILHLLELPPRHAVVLKVLRRPNKAVKFNTHFVLILV